MNQSQTVNLQVKVSLELTQDQEPSIKRIQTVQSLKELLAACRQVCNLADVPSQQKLSVYYRDSDNDRLDVTDDSDLQIAYASALSTDCKVKFHIDLHGYVHKIEPKMEQQKAEPDVALADTQAESEMPPIVEPIVEKEPEPLQEKVQEIQEKIINPEPEVEEIVPEILPDQEQAIEVPKIEADLDDEAESELSKPAQAPHKGKKGKGKGKKGKKGKCGGGAADLPRKAIKNLIRQELESAVPGIFDKLMQESDNLMDEQDPAIEESKDEQPIEIHVGVACDGCEVAPITGIRYKCAVLKDFDYCAKCEATIPHDHPFLKIRKAGGAPSMIFTVLQDDQGNDQRPDWKQMKDAWKAAKQDWKQDWKQKHGFGCGWKKDLTEEDIAQKKTWMKDMLAGFMGGKNVCGSPRRGGSPGKGWGKHKIQRATVVSSPDEVLKCAPGCVVLHDIEVKNNTSWGWKQGCSLGLDSSIEQKGLPFELINVPVDQKVEAMAILKITVPFTVFESAQPGDVQEYKLRFRGPKGSEFGETIPVKIQIVAAQQEPKKDEPVQVEEPKKDEPIKAEEPKKEDQPKKPSVELVKLAIKLFNDEKLGQTFQECIEVVTLLNGDEELAKKCLQPRQ